MNDNTPAREPYRRSSEQLLAEARQFLAENSDIAGDDIALALESELPDALGLIDAYAAAHTDARDYAAATRERVRILEARAQRLEDRADRLRRAMGRVLLELQLTHRHTPSGLARIQHTAGKVQITDADSLPEAFMRTKREPDKLAIRRALEAGEDVPGAVKGNGSMTVVLTT